MFSEAKQSQLPAVELLVKMGWRYLPRAEALALRHGDESRALLTDVLERSLMRLNDYQLDGQRLKFSPSDIKQKVDELENIRFEGLIDTSKLVSGMIMPKIGGATIKIKAGGKVQERSIRYFDFKQPENNEYQVTVEYQYLDREPIRADIICFVNGIPLIQIENKKSSVGYQQAVGQLLRYQRPDQAAKLYPYLKLLLALDGENAVYATVGSTAKFYTCWRSIEQKERDQETAISDLLLVPIAAQVEAQIRHDLNCGASAYPQKSLRTVKPQDKTIYELLAPATILDFLRDFVFFDGNEQKVARYQQVRAVKKILGRIKTWADSPTGSSRRQGGLIWHTQGSGKSLTMVMLVRALIEDPEIINPRVLLVTDRIDLDRQISQTFKNVGLKKEIKKMRSGKDLLNHLQKKDSAVLTTLVHKFQKACLKNATFSDLDPNIFVLIDEVHRSEYGVWASQMTQLIPNACVLGFTGTPLLKKDKSTQKYGSFIDCYTIDDALADQVVVPLIYEGRFVPLAQDGVQMDRDLDHTLQPLTKEQKNQLTQTIQTKKITGVPSRVERVCSDIAAHYGAFFQNTGLKGQVVASSRFVAVQMHQWFRQNGQINTALVISDDQNETPETAAEKFGVSKYLRELSQDYSDLKKYEQAVTDKFKASGSEVELLIVVHKLLTGFDVPSNSVLYLDRQLQDHNLLQAIARVNRIFDQGSIPKTAGYIIDYSQNAQHLSEAMALFGNYDPQDVRGTLSDVKQKIRQLESVRESINHLFRGLPRDDHVYIAHLANEAKRRRFKDKLNRLLNIWRECLCLRDFSLCLGAKKFELLRSDLGKLLDLKKTVELRFGERVDFRQYEWEIRRILGKHIKAEPAVITTPATPVLTKDFNQALAQLDSDRTRAEAIAAQTQRIIRERYETDVVYYERFSQKIEEILQQIHQGKLADAQALSQLKNIYKIVICKKSDDLPDEIGAVSGAGVLYRNLKEQLPLADEVYRRVVLELTRTVRDHAWVDWHKNHELQRQIRSYLDDYLYEQKELVDYALAEKIIDAVMKLAQANHEEFTHA